MKIPSSPFANRLRISLETELKNLQASQQSARADAGAAITLMAQRMELLDRMFSLLEKKTVMAGAGDREATANAKQKKRRRGLSCPRQASPSPPKKAIPSPRFSNMV
jgi:hypothetical protein